jgi:hypothetical protein
MKNKLIRRLHFLIEKLVPSQAYQADAKWFAAELTLGNSSTSLIRSTGTALAPHRAPPIAPTKTGQ